VKISGPLVSHDMSFATDAIAAGIGIGLVPEVYCGWAMTSPLRLPTRGLVRLLPDHGVTGAEVSLVSPPTAYEPTRVALLRDFLADRLRPMMKACNEAVEEERAGRRLRRSSKA
jgi:DNA-binding transcriptional LysR family regulator